MYGIGHAILNRHLLTRGTTFASSKFSDFTFELQSITIVACRFSKKNVAGASKVAAGKSRAQRTGEVPFPTESHMPGFGAQQQKSFGCGSTENVTAWNRRLEAGGNLGTCSFGQGRPIGSTSTERSFPILVRRFNQTVCMGLPHTLGTAAFAGPTITGRLVHSLRPSYTSCISAHSQLTGRLMALSSISITLCN
jgi:hypothetical protein